MNERQLIINKALEQVGYLGKRSNKDLDNKTANASGKYTKYARDLDNLKDSIELMERHLEDLEKELEEYLRK